MTFELPEVEHNTLEPLREELEREVATDWKVSLEKLEALVEGDPRLQEMLDEVLDQCLRYTKTVLEELQLRDTEGPGEEHSRKDEERTITHTATQDTIRAFARNLIKSGKTATDLYPLLPNPESRAACGQFALRLTLTRGSELVQ